MSKMNSNNTPKTLIEIDEVIYLFLLEMKQEESLNDISDAVRLLLIRS
jgi:hypothetical protein